MSFKFKEFVSLACTVCGVLACKLDLPILEDYISKNPLYQYETITSGADSKRENIVELEQKIGYIRLESIQFL